MEYLMDQGIDIILWFQTFSPSSDLFFKFFTFMGNETFYLLFLPLIYWCINRNYGIRLAVLFLFSAYLNAVAKVLANQPRPFTYDTRVKQLTEAGGGGLPSGHTQNSVVTWGYLAVEVKRAWLWVVTGLLIIFIPLSRVYLGVHFPTDLLGGYVIGSVLLIAYIRSESAAVKWLNNKGFVWQLSLAVIIPLFFVLIFLTEAGITSSATLMGIVTGAVLESKFVGFSVSGTWWKRVFRFLIGILGLFVFWTGLKILFSGAEPELLFRFIRYLVVGLWISLGGPWIFIILGLAKKDQNIEEEFSDFNRNPESCLRNAASLR